MSRTERIEPRLFPKVETRDDVSWSYAAGLGSGGSSGSGYAAENLSAVLGAVELIANTLASLPVSLTMDTPDGRVPAPSTATAWRLLARPNPRQSWPAFVTTLTAGMLLNGNAVSRIEADGRGAVSSLTPVPWGWLQPQVVNGGAGPRLVFDVMQASPEAALLGIPRRLLETDVLHVRARSEAGIIGRSVLSRAPQVLASASGVANFASAVWENSARPSGMVTVPKGMSKDARERMMASVDARSTGTHNAGRLFYADEGAGFVPLAMTPGDVEVLASRRFSVEDLARLFCIPLPLLQMSATVPASLTPYVIAFAQLAVAPIVAAIEAEFDNSVLPAGMHLAIDMAGLMRGDYSAVAAAQAVLVQSRIATPNDARRALGLPAHDDGDDLGTGDAPNYPADANGAPSLGPKPGPGGTLPNVGTHQNGGAER